MIFKDRTIKAAIFDMDGTMFDTERLRFKTIQQASDELFGTPISHEVLLGSLGLSAKKAEELAQSVYGTDYPYKDIRRRADELELAHIRTYGVPIKKGLFQVLERLKKNDMLMAVATSSRREIAEEYLINANVMKYFDITVCGDEVQLGKPHPEIFLTAAHELNCPPEHCFMFEDSENGLLSAFGAGGIPILIKDIKEPKPEIKQKAFQFYESMTEFLQELADATPNLPIPKLIDAFPQAINQLKVGIHGFGAMGGGYLTQVFSHWDGYTRPMEITAATGNSVLRNLINAFGKYHVDYSKLAFDQTIDHIRLIDIADEEAMLQMYVESEIIGLCLPEAAIKQQASLIAQGLLARHHASGREITLLIILNKVSGATFVKKQVKQALSLLTDEVTCKQIIDHVYFTETVVNRIVSKASNKALIKQAKINFYSVEGGLADKNLLSRKNIRTILPQGEDPTDQSIQSISEKLDVMSNITDIVNSFNVTVFNSGPEMALYAQKGSKILEQLRQVQVFDNMKEIQMIKNKLLNGTHAIIAWYGSLLGYQSIGQGMGDPRVLALVKKLVNHEIKPAILKESPVSANFMNTFIQNFIQSCKVSFKDPCARVARDPLRKLQRKERIIGSIDLAQKYEIATPMLEFGTALGLLYAIRLINPNDKESQLIHSMYKEQQSIVPILTYHDRYNGQSYQSLDREKDHALIERITDHFNRLNDPSLNHLDWPLEKS
ncbi:bifunctional mannitol-1-phosphate dehydrogenase/phosphatase [Aquirhabdus sp.]|uniref:bifunctional mannitol-1-phosphate dehydrogenase/phosphatase n=1 Tax=Aquirhabdus sp. TaxID=2824160 RepID=UPI00396CA147